MAQVFQCDACEKSGVEKAGAVRVGEKVTKDLCTSCMARVEAILEPKPKKKPN